MRTRHQNYFKRAFKALCAALFILGAPLLRAQTNATPPVNDSFTNAIVVTGTDFQLEADLGAATFEANEPDFPFALTFRKTAWWKWTPSENCRIQWNAGQSSNLVAVWIYEVTATNQFEYVAATPWLADHHGYNVPMQYGSLDVRTGKQYLIRLDIARAVPAGVPLFLPSPSLVPKPVSVHFQKPPGPAPTNDNFGNRILLSGTNITFTADLSAATSETNEPLVAPNSLHHTLWWTWTAPDFGSVTITTRNTNESAALAIYAEATHFPLTSAASSITEYGNQCHAEFGTRGTATWHVAPGARYTIQVDRFLQLADLTPFELELAFNPAPTNDTVEGATLLEGNDISLQVSNLYSTHRTNEPTIPGQSGANSVWFKWTAPTNGILQATRLEPIRYEEPSSTPWEIGLISWSTVPIPCNSYGDIHALPPFIAVFGLFAGDPATPASPMPVVAYGTNGITSDVIAGKTYWLQLDGAQDTSGETPLNLLFIPSPLNDSFANRIRLTSESLKVTGRTFAASHEATDPAYSATNALMSRSVWWQWQMPTSGRWTFFVTQGAWDNKFAVYRGTNATGLSEIKNSSNEPIIFEGQAGDVFQIGVFALTTFGGNIEFTLKPVTAPALRFSSGQDYWNQGVRNNRLQLPNNSGLPYVVERSFDLQQWTPVLTNANAWSHPIDLLTEVGLPQTFFRTRLWTQTTP